MERNPSMQNYLDVSRTDSLKANADEKTDHNDLNKACESINEADGILDNILAAKILPDKGRAKEIGDLHQSKWEGRNSWELDAVTDEPVAIADTSNQALCTSITR